MLCHPVLHQPILTQVTLSAVLATPSKKQLEAPVGGGVAGKPKESESPGKSGRGGVEREKEISELKALVTRLTKNNQEMLALLTERVRKALHAEMV